MCKAVKVLGGVSLLLILISFPTCYLGEQFVQPELAKLSLEERELRQFDMEYVRYVLPGIGLFLVGSALALAAAGRGISDYLAKRRQRGAKP